MRDTILNRLKRLEMAKNTTPHATVTFSDGHRERLDIHDIAKAFFDRNPAGIVSVEWERSKESSTIFQLLSYPDTWENLTIERIIENEQNKSLL